MTVIRTVSSSSLSPWFWTSTSKPSSSAAVTSTGTPAASSVPDGVATTPERARPWTPGAAVWSSALDRRRPRRVVTVSGRQPLQVGQGRRGGRRLAAAELRLAQAPLDRRLEASREEDVAGQQQAHLARHRARSLAPTLVGQRARQVAGHAGHAVAAQLERHGEVAVRVGQLARRLHGRRAVGQARGPHRQAVHVALHLDQALVAGVAQQREHRAGELRRFLGERAGVLRVVGEGALAARVPARAHAEDDQHEHQHPDADRDELPGAHGGVGRRALPALASGAPTRGRAALGWCSARRRSGHRVGLVGHWAGARLPPELGRRSARAWEYDRGVGGLRRALRRARGTEGTAGPRAKPEAMDRETTTDRLDADAPTDATAALGDRRARPRRERDDATRPLAPGRAPRLEPDALVLERYRLDERLGAGGFGVVWLAFDERLERDVAVKAVPREGLGTWKRVEREARAAARLGHPGIVALYEFGADEDRAYLVSEYVAGRTLAELLEGGAISDRDTARVGAALCDALEHAHARGVIHRDVKPQNVMVVSEPAAGAGFAKLADFGASRLASEDALTRTGDVVGTLAYMAPEQAEGHEVTGAADLYALALTLYEALAGFNPARGRGLADTARRVGRPLPELAPVRPDLPARLTEAIDRALDPDPAWRGTLAELRAGLADAERGLSSAGGLEEPETLERFGLRRRRRRGWLEALFMPPPREPPPGQERHPDAHPAPGEHPGEARRASALLWRAGAAAGAAVLATVVLDLPGVARLPVDTALVALAVAAGVAVLPRVAWLVAAAALVAWIGLAGDDAAGLALLAATAAVCVPVLLPRAGVLWSAPALAVALGWIGIAPAFCALAGLARGTLRRIGLAAAGFVWIALAELATGERLLFGPPEGAASASALAGSASRALRDGLVPLLTTPALVPALVAAAFAALLPLAVRGRTLGADLLLGAVWSGSLAVVLVGLGEQTAEWGLATAPRGAVEGSVLGVLTALGAAWLWRRMARQ